LNLASRSRWKYSSATKSAAGSNWTAKSSAVSLWTTSESTTIPWIWESKYAATNDAST